MRRWLILLLLVLMPLQLSWAAAAPYCGHEKSESAQHFGHHAHEHAHASDDGTTDDNGGLLTVDNDCPVCHLGCGHLMETDDIAASPTGSSITVASDLPMPSHVPPGLERPDRRLA